MHFTQQGPKERQIITIRSSAEVVLVQQISKVEVIMGR